jgi:hypothetical protein
MVTAVLPIAGIGRSTEDISAGPDRATSRGAIATSCRSSGTRTPWAARARASGGRARSWCTIRPSTPVSRSATVVSTSSCSWEVSTRSGSSPISRQAISYPSRARRA